MPDQPASTPKGGIPAIAPHTLAVSLRSALHPPSSIRSVLLGLAFAVALLAGLGDRPLLEPDEGRYAEMAREMAVSSDWRHWVVPRLNGVEHFNKPPLLHWTAALSLRAFGVNEWAARLPSALAAGGALLLVAWIGRMLASPRVGLAAAGILLASLEFFALARSLTPDMLMTFFITLAIACFVRWTIGPGRGWQWGFFVAMGLGFLVKGPMAIVVPTCAAAACQIAARRAWRREQARRAAVDGPNGEALPAPPRIAWVAGMLLTLGIAFSWFILVAATHPGLFRFFVEDELLGRFGSRAHGRSQGWWFFLPVMIGGVLPWLFAALGGLMNLKGEWRAGWRPSPTGWLLFGWIVPPFLILSASGSKLFTYVLPIFPAVALWLAGTGRWRDPAWKRWPRKPTASAAFWGEWWRRTSFFTGFMLLAAPLLAAGFAALTLRRWEEKTQTAPWFGAAAVALVALGGLALWWCVRRGREGAEGTARWAGLETAGAALAAFAVGLWLLLSAQLPRWNHLLGRQAAVRDLARTAQARPDFAQAALFSWNVRAHGWEFYLGQLVAMARADADVRFPPDAATAARLFDDRAELLARHVGDRPGYGLTLRREFESVWKPDGWRELGRSGEFVLMTNRPD